MFVAKLFLGPIVVENSKGDTGFPDPSGTDESNWTKVFGELDDLLNQLFAAKERPWWWRR